MMTIQLTDDERSKIESETYLLIGYKLALKEVMQGLGKAHSEFWQRVRELRPDEVTATKEYSYNPATGVITEL